MRSWHARNLLMDLGDQKHRVKFMIHDHGLNFTAHSTLPWLTPVSGPSSATSRRNRVNAYAERWIGGCRREVLGRTSSRIWPISGIS